MPWEVELEDGETVVEFPDDATQREAELYLRKEFPLSGESIAKGLDEDPAFTPTLEEYKRFEEFSQSNDKEGSFLEGLFSFADNISRLAVNAGKSIAKDPGFLVNHRLDEQVNTLSEMGAQGTVMMNQLVQHSTDPESFLFKAKTKLSGNSSAEDRYDQFLDARAYGQMVLDLDNEGRLSVPDDAELNQELVELGREFVDPTVVLPGLGLSKFATKGMQAVAGAAARGAARVTKRGADVVGGAANLVKEAGEQAPLIPHIPGTGLPAKTEKSLRAIGEGFEAAGRPATKRLGFFSSIAADPGNPAALGLTFRAISHLGGDKALKATTSLARGGVEGSLIGGALSEAHNRDFATGAGAGFYLGSLSGFAGRIAESVTGKSHQDAMKADLEIYQNKLPPETVDAITEMSKGNTRTALDMFDLHELAAQGDDVRVMYLDQDAYTQALADQFGIPAEKVPKTRGVSNLTLDGKPTVLINKSIGDTQIAHEVLGHALGRFEDMSSEVLRLHQEVLKGTDSQVALRDAETYANSLGDFWKASRNWEKITPGEKVQLSIEEQAADLAEGLVRSSKKNLVAESQKPWRFYKDRLILSEADSFLGRIYSGMRRFGIDLDDVNASSSSLYQRRNRARINAAVRDIVRARKRVRGRLDLLESDVRSLVRKKNIHSDNVLGKELEQIGLTRQAGNHFELRRNSEIHADEVNTSQEIIKILEDTPSEDGVRGFTNEDGNREFAGAKFSPAQLEAVLASTVLPETLRKVVSAVNDIIGRGRGIDISYFAATRRDAQGRTRYSSGIKRSDRVLLPYGLEVTKAGNFVIRALDYTKLQSKISKLMKANPKQFKEAFGDNVTFAEVLGEFRSYVENLSASEGVRKPSAEVFGVKKRDVFQRILGPRNPQGNLGFTRLDEAENVIRTFRPDRITKMTILPDLMPPVTEQAYKLSQANFSEARTEVGFEGPKKIGRANLWSSPEGYKAIRPTPRSKIRVYHPSGKKVPGFFDSLEAASKATVNN